MKEYRTLTCHNDDIVIHALGPGYGESVVLTVGGRLVIGLDSCSALVQATASGQSYLDAILSRCHKDPLVFWVLTHFHFDHFQSFSLVLDALGRRLKKLFVPGDYLSADLGFEVARHAEEDDGLAAFHLAGDEYSRLRRRLESPDLARIATTVGGSLQFLDLTLRTPHKKVRIRADLYGPQYALGSALVGTAVNQVAAGVHERSQGNHTSYIIRIRAGRFDSLFLADAPIARSRDCLPGSDSPAGMFVLKVAHHGAIDGTNAELLTALRIRARKRVALICPFRSHGLPQAEVLRLLARDGFQTAVCEPRRSTNAQKSRLLSRTDLSTKESDWPLHSPDASVKVVRTRL